MSVTAGGFLAHWNSNVDGRIPPTTSRRLTAPPFTPPTGMILKISFDIVR